MVALGVIAIILNFLNLIPNILIWVYNSGETTAWFIKISLIVVGAILFFIGKNTTKEIE